MAMGYCDACGKRRSIYSIGGSPDDRLGFCYICTKKDERRYRSYGIPFFGDAPPVVKRAVRAVKKALGGRS